MSAAERARTLAHRRQALLAHSAQQRRQLLRDATALHQALSPAAWLARGAVGIRRHPSWLLAGIAGVFILGGPLRRLWRRSPEGSGPLGAARRRPRHLGTRRWLGHALTAWQLWQTIQRWLPAHLAGPGSRAP